MGLFSGEDKTYVSTTTTRLIEDSKFISSIKSGTIKSIFAKSSDTVDYIMEDLVNGLGFTAKAYYKHGRDKYPYGLPVATGVSRSMGGKIVEAQLKSNLGAEVIIKNNYVGPFNFWFEAFRVVDAIHSIDYDTGKLQNTSNNLHKEVYMAGQVLLMNQATYDSLPPDTLLNKVWPKFKQETTVQIDQSQPNNVIKLFFTYIWDTGETTTTGGGEGGPMVVTPIYDGHQEIMPDNLFPAGFDPGAQYFQTTYTNQAGTNTGYFRYHIGDGTYPLMDNVFNPAVNQTGSYFPWVYFRYNKIKGNEDKTDPGYLSAKKMLKKAHMNYDDICDKIHENPDIADVEQAMLMWSVEADSQHPMDQRYLYEYFDSVFIDSGGAVWDLEHADLTPDRMPFLINANSLIVQDARFKLGISNFGMFRRTYAGSIGPVGTYASGELDLSFKYQVTQEGEGGSYTFDQFWPLPSHYYRKQVQPGWFEEIMVIDLSVRYNIYGDYGVTADGDTDDTRTDLLLLPIDLAITKHFSLLDREEFYSRSLHFIFNARVTVHLAWYQSDFFQFFVIVAALVIALWDGGASLTTYLAALGAMTIEAALWTLLITGLEYLAAAVAFKLFVKVVGVKIAFLVAIVAIAYGMTAQLGDKIEVGFSQNMPYAGDLLKVGNGLAKAVKSEMAGDLAGMQSEMAELTKQSKLITDEAEKINKEMDENSTYTPFIVFGEAPEDFFNRTVHSGNIGIIGIDAVSNFVERSLTLPQPFESLGES